MSRVFFAWTLRGLAYDAPAVTLPDSDVPIACPRCGQPLVYRGRAYDVQIYDCARDGRIVLRPDGTIGLATGVEQLYKVEPEAPPRSPVRRSYSHGRCCVRSATRRC